MDMEQLLKKLGYSDDDTQKIIAGMETERLYVTKEEKIEERYSKLKEQKADVDGQLEAATKTIDDLKKANKGNEELQAAIKQHEQTIKQLKEDSEAKIRDLTIDNALTAALNAGRAKHPELLLAKFDREKLALDKDGKVSGVDEQLKQLQKSYSDLFNPAVSGTPPTNPDHSQNATYDGIVANADNMSPEEVAQAFDQLKQ